MGYRVCKSTGVIHACGKGFKKVCKKSTMIKAGNYEDFRTKDEAVAAAKEKRSPVFCKICDFRDALQEETDR